nr:Citrate synthase [Klebsiella pneumoniae]
MHGGANESSMRMLEEIESVDQVPAFLRRAKRDPQAFRRLVLATRATVTVTRAPISCVKPAIGCWRR